MPLADRLLAMFERPIVMRWLIMESVAKRGQSLTWSQWSVAATHLYRRRRSGLATLGFCDRSSRGREWHAILGRAGARRTYPVPYDTRQNSRNWRFFGLAHQPHGPGLVDGQPRTTDLVVDAVTMAVSRRGGHVPGVIHHSDRGGEYTSHTLERELRRHGALASMGSVADCFDNALPRAAVFDYLEAFYNSRRRHSSLGQISPAAFEARHTAQTAAA